MPIFPDPAGGSMEVSGEAEARERGWTPSMGSFGVESYPEGTGNDSPGPGPQQQNPFAGFDIGAITRGFAASAGMSQKQLDEQIRQFDLTLAWQKELWEKQGLPQLAIQQRAADLEEKKFAELTDLSRRQQSWVEEIGRRQAALAEKTQADANAIAQGQLGLGREQLGLQTLEAASRLRGPADWIQAANFNRGVAQSNLPAFISQLLQGGAGTAALGGPAPGAQMSSPLTMGRLAADLGVGGVAANEQAPGGTYTRGGLMTSVQPGGEDMATAADMITLPNGAVVDRAEALRQGYVPPSGLAARMAETRSQLPSTTNVDTAAQQLRNVYQAGGQALAPQALEGLTPTEMSMFTGGGESVGADVPGFVEAYKRSRIGQQSSMF